VWLKESSGCIGIDDVKPAELQEQYRLNAFEVNTFAGRPLLWHDNVNVGNWWHDYNYTGFYNISSDTGDDNVDLFPSKSLELFPPAPIDFEILETGNTLTWNAYALNPSTFELFIDGQSVLVEPWDGGNIEVNVDGLAHGSHSVEAVVYHVSGHWLGNESAANVEDLTPPSAIQGPGEVLIVVGGEVSVQYSSHDSSGVEWSVDDDVNFAIDSTGLLTSIVDLTVES
jgi:hypothetical protein